MSNQMLYIAMIPTKYEVIALAATEAEAIRLVSEKAFEFLTEADAIYPETDSPAKVTEYFGVTVTHLAVGTADYEGEGNA